MARLIWICVLPLLLLAAWLAVDNLQTRRAEQSLAGKELARGLGAAIDQHLLARIQGLTLLAASPLIDERDRLASYQQGANSLVRKPVDFGEFAETVARLGVYWLATNDAPPEV